MHGIPEWFALLLHPALWWAIGVFVVGAIGFVVRAIWRRVSKKGSKR